VVYARAARAWRCRHRPVGGAPPAGAQPPGGLPSSPQPVRLSTPGAFAPVECQKTTQSTPHAMFGWGLLGSAPARCCPGPACSMAIASTPTGPVIPAECRSILQNGPWFRRSSCVTWQRQRLRARSWPRWSSTGPRVPMAGDTGASRACAGCCAIPSIWCRSMPIGLIAARREAPFPATAGRAPGNHVRPGCP
jgi:hypothetical protein